MKSKITIVLNSIFLIILLFPLGTLFYGNWKVELLCFFPACFLVFLLRKLSLQIPTIYLKQNERKHLLIFLLLDFLKECSLITLINGFSLYSFLFPILISFFEVGVFLLFKKIATSYEAWSSLFLIFILPLNLWFSNPLNIIFMLLPLMSLYIYTFLDGTTLHRKRNDFLFLIFGVLLWVSFKFNFFASLVIFVIFLNLWQNTKRKYAIRFIGISFLSFIGCLIVTEVLFKWTGLELTTFNYQFHSSFLDAFKTLNSALIYTNIVELTLFLLVFLGALSSLKYQESTFLTLLISAILSILSMIFLKYQTTDLFPVLTIFILLGGNSLSVLLKNQVRHTKIKHFSIKRNIKEIKKVSVVIPNYNYENYILERIDSILNQTYPIFELIILDDCSTDNSVEIITKKMEEIKKTHPNLNIQFLPSKKNSGNVFKQWEKAFKVSHGDYLWIAEADDSCSNLFLENVMKGFDHKNVILSYCESLTMDENNKILMRNLREWIDIFKTGKWNHSYINQGTKEIKETSCINCTIANVSSVVFKKEKQVDFSKYLKKSQEFRLAGDWYFYIQVLAHGDIYYNKKSLNYHRMHQNSITLTTKKIQEYQEITWIQNDIMKHYKISSEVRKKIEKRCELLRKMFSISSLEADLMNMDFEKIRKRKKIGNEILLSIIVPVYNTEPYLDKCFSSILQTLPPQTEVIIINDGTKDHSEEIIKKYEQEYKDVIRYIKKENGGLSDTKNVGLQAAKGRYIGFVDSDDWVRPNMFSCMLKEALLEEADIVFCDVNLVYEDGTTKYSSSLNELEKNELMQKLNTSLMAASWSKIVKKELFHGLEYPKNHNNEDVAVSPILIARSKKTAYIPSPFYQYFQRTGSIMNSGFNEKSFDLFYASHLCFENALEFDINTQEIIKGAIYITQLLPTLCYVISEIKDKKERRRYIALFCDEMAEFKNYQNNKYVKRFIKDHGVFSLLDAIERKDILQIEKELRHFDHN